MEKKKVLVTASTFPRWINDTEPRFVLDLAKGLQKYCDITVLAPATPGALEEEWLEDVHVIRYHYFPISSWETLCYPGAILSRIKERKMRALLVPFLFLGLFNAIRKNYKDYDLIHAHWVIPQGIVQSIFNKKYIITGHGSDIVSMNNFFIRKLKERCLNKASYITLVSGYLKENVKRISVNQQIEVIPMGCSTKDFKPENRIENYWNQGEKKVILSVGRLVETKGIQYLIDAVKTLDVLLVIVGSGEYEASLKRQAKGYEDKVLFAGSFPHEKLKTIYASADIFVFPSISSREGGQEGLGLVVLEAMASGLPVIACRTGGITDIIVSEENGILVNEKDSEAIKEKIQLLIKDDEYRTKMREKAMVTGKKYDIETIAKQYYDIMEQVW